MLRVTKQALTAMIEHCRGDYPNEACGILAGRDGLATETIPMRNLHASPSSYEMDPKEQLSVQRRLRMDGLDILAIYHSHVATEAFPSRRDIERATAIQDFFGGHYVVVTLRDPTPRARAFKIRDGHAREEPLVEED